MLQHLFSSLLHFVDVHNECFSPRVDQFNVNLVVTFLHLDLLNRLFNRGLPHVLLRVVVTRRAFSQVDLQLVDLGLGLLHLFEIDLFLQLVLLKVLVV